MASTQPSNRRPSRARAAGMALAASAAASLGAGCATPQLVPARATPDGRARVHASGVELVADSEPSARPWQLPHDLTLVRLTVRNASPRAIFVELEDIRLEGNAHRLPALAPGSIEPRRRVDSLGMSPSSPLIGQNQARPGHGSSPGTVETIVFEPGFYGVLHESKATERERAPIVAPAFPAGAIPSGGSADGMVYFQSPPDDVRELTLRVSVRSGPSEEPSSVLQIDYSVRG